MALFYWQGVVGSAFNSRAYGAPQFLCGLPEIKMPVRDSFFCFFFFFFFFFFFLCLVIFFPSKGFWAKLAFFSFPGLSH